VTKAPIDRKPLSADDQEKLEKMMAPYRAIEEQSREAGPRGKRGGTIGHSGMCVLEAFLTFRLRRPSESLRLSREAIARAALLSPRTVGRTIQRLANLGLITVQGGKVYEINQPTRALSTTEPQTIPAAAPSTVP
jgi:CRP-like cAMP-binding protein